MNKFKNEIKKLKNKKIISIKIQCKNQIKHQKSLKCL